MKKALVAGMVLLAAIAGSACSSGDGGDGNNSSGALAFAPGAFFIQLYGGASGTGSGADGGPGGTFVINAQAEAWVLNTGSVAFPAVTYGPSPTVIAVNQAWTDADNYGPDGQPGVALVDDDAANGVDDCGEYQWAGSDDNLQPDGFAVAAGVVITLDSANLTCTGELNVIADGPIVMAGAIATVATNTFPIDVVLTADSLGDETIIMSGAINASGPDSSTGAGLPGGAIVLVNNLNADVSPIIVSGALASNGGDSTFTNGSGGPAGQLIMVGGDDADILVQANISLNGGAGNGTGSGGPGGMINAINNEGIVDNTLLGKIVFYNVNSISGMGGSGQELGGAGMNMAMLSSEAGVALFAQVNGSGGDNLESIATGVGGPGGFLQLISNGDGVLPANLISEANISTLGAIVLTGGKALGGTATGGNGGIFVAVLVEGSFTGGAPMNLSGGDGLATNGNGGNAGIVQIVDAFNSEPGPYWISIVALWANGGDADHFGGDGGMVLLMNQNTPNDESRIIVGNNAISVIAGDGDDTILGGDGNSGTIQMLGNVQD